MRSNTKAILGLTLALLAALSWLVWGGGDGDPLDLATTGPAAHERSVEEADVLRPVAAGDRERADEPALPVLPAAEETTGPSTEEANAPLPIGTVEVVVVRAGPAADGSFDVPVSEGRVWIGLVGVFLPRELEDDPERTRVAPLDLAGTARFTAIPAGPHPVGVALPGRALLQGRVIVPPGEGARCLVRLGDSGLRGVVHDPLGAVVSGARVQISRRIRPRVHVVLWTDSNGAYDARDLPAGPYGVGVDLSGIQDPNGADYSALVDLEEGAVLEHDFGDPLGSPLWTGVVRTTAGERVTRNGVGGWGCRMHLERVDDGTYSYRVLEDDGTFAVRLVPGSYRVALSPPGRRERTTVLEELSIDGDTSRDLVLPGTTLAGFAAEGPWISLRESRAGRPLVSVKRPADGRYRFDGVAPGTSWLTAGELALEVEVRAEDVALEIDLR